MINIMVMLIIKNNVKSHKKGRSPKTLSRINKLEIAKDPFFMLINLSSIT